VADLWGEIIDQISKLPGGRNKENEQKILIAAINYPRACEKWYPHTPGVDPKEHWSMLEHAQLEERRREFDLKLFEMGQRTERRNFTLAVVIGLFSAVQVFLTLYASSAAFRRLVERFLALW
jgi:hypothetical protein